MSVSKQQGGLGFKQVYPQGNIALMALGILASSQSTNQMDQLFYANLNALKWDKPRLLCRQNYSLIEKLFFSKPKTFCYCLYTKGMWLALAALHDILSYLPPRVMTPSHWKI